MEISIVVLLLVLVPFAVKDAIKRHKDKQVQNNKTNNAYEQSIRGQRLVYYPNHGPDMMEKGE